MLYILCISSVIYNFHGYYRITKKFIPEVVGLSEQDTFRTSERDKISISRSCIAQRCEVFTS